MPASSPRIGDHVRRVQASLAARLRTYFLNGLVLTAPVLITAYLVITTIRLIDGWVEPLFPPGWRSFAVPGLGLILVISALTLVGAVLGNVMGRWLVSLWEGLVTRLPVIRSIYNPVKQVFDTVISPDAVSFREVVLAPFPHPDVRSIAFVTGKAPPSVASAMKSGEAWVYVYIPTAPSAYAGFLTVMPRSQLIAVDMPVDEALSSVVSLGIAGNQPERSKGTAESRSIR
ncbi:MAG: DUF502 domain-containing protein [Sphingomonadales bacterium]|nr:MAG: DUF502 domain-containing protein [Sphingomonadales bacterium]